MTDLFNQPAVELCDGVDKHMPSHNRNGNDESYQENKEHFAGQTKLVWELLLQGETITGERMFMEHRVQDVRPRIATIKKYLEVNKDYELQESKVPNGHGAKQWQLIKKVS